MINRKNIMVEDAEYGVDSRHKNIQEKNIDSVNLMQARLDRMKNLSKEQIIKARLIQLKLRMENYIKEPVYDQKNYFLNFLETYIDTIYSKRSLFAKDMDITPVSLSQILNNHREPKDEFIKKLMIHSESVFKNVCSFQKKIWYQVYFHEKICDTMLNQEEWRPEIEKHIRISETIH